MTGPLVVAPRKLVERKPRHGEPCNNCGLCCHMSLCPLAQHVFHRPMYPGPCPALQWEGEKSRCGLVMASTKKHAEAAAWIIGSGEGCDARINGEPSNEAFNAQLDRRDVEHAQEIAEAKALWGMR